MALAVAVPPAAAQDVVGRLDRTVIDWWGEREGLPQSWVVSIAQTPDGYLYLSTLEGVVRFDGVRFLPVRRPDAGRPASNRMGAMVLRRDGSLWVASENAGIFRVEGTALVLEHAARSLRLPTALAEDAGGALWVVAEGGVHRISPQGSLEQLDVSERVPAGVGAIAVTRAGAVWVAAPEGLARRVEGRFEALPSERAPRGAPVALHVTRDDAVLVLTAEGLFRLEGERCLRLGAAPPFTPLPGASIFEDRDGALWVGAGRQGLARFHGGAWSLVPARRGLTGTHVRALLRDREGSLWIGTEGRGLARMRDTSFAVLGRAEGLRDPFVWAHLVDRAGTLWIGSQDGTLHSWAGDTLRVFGREDGLPGGGVRALAQRRDGTLLVGTLGYGVWARRGPRFEPLRGAEALRLAAVRTMREDPWDGALWIGTERGLFRLGEGRLARAGEGGLRKTVTSLLFDRQRRLCVGTTGEGLWWSADRGASFSRIDDADGLPDRSVRALHEDAEGRLWVGTEGGGLAVVRDGRVAAAVSQREGLFDNTVSVILDDGLGWMWMSCNRGVFRARIADLVEVVEGRRERVASEVFDEADGLISRECNGSSEPAGLRHADGSLSFSTMGGVAFVDPARLRAPVPAPPVVVERLVHDGIDTPLGSRVRLPPGRGNLELQFTAPTFLGAERVRFRFRLAPFDDWSEPVARRSAYYTNVPPGAYTFEVVAAGRDGRWSAPPAAVELELRPHLWQTWAFRGGLAVAAAAAAFAAYRRRVGRLERDRRTLAALVAERTGALAEANAELARLAATDPGTGLPNRRRLEEFLGEEWRRAQRLRQPLGVLMVDVDHFKAFNDLYGHQRGDEVLVRVAGVLRESVRRAGELAARYGGEEFAVVLGGCGGDELPAIAERVRAGVAELGLRHEGSPTAGLVTVSVGGAACVPAPDGAPSDLVRRADAALYAAKRTRNSVAVLADDWVARGNAPSPGALPPPVTG